MRAALSLSIIGLLAACAPASQFPRHTEAEYASNGNLRLDTVKKCSVIGGGGVGYATTDDASECGKAQEVQRQYLRQQKTLSDDDAMIARLKALDDKMPSGFKK